MLHARLTTCTISMIPYRSLSSHFYICMELKPLFITLSYVKEKVEILVVCHIDDQYTKCICIQRNS